MLLTRELCVGALGGTTTFDYAKLKLQHHLSTKEMKILAQFIRDTHLTHINIAMEVSKTEADEFMDLAMAIRSKAELEVFELAVPKIHYAVASDHDFDFGGLFFRFFALYTYARYAIIQSQLKNSFLTMIENKPALEVLTVSMPKAHKLQPTDLRRLKKDLESAENLQEVTLTMPCYDVGQLEEINQEHTATSLGAALN